MLSLDDTLEAVQRAENLPSMPAVAVEVLRLTRDEDSTLDDLAQAISMDPALAAKLLQLSNSSAYSMGSPVTTLQRATMVLGLKSVKMMSLSFSLASSLPKDGDVEFDFDTYWRRSIVTAVAGRAIARLTNQPTADEAFLCGLLSGVGQLVLSNCTPELYGEVIRSANGDWPTPEFETKTIGFDHTVVGGVLLEVWSMPDLIRETVTHQADPDQIDSEFDPETAKLAQVINLATHATSLLCGNNPSLHLKQLQERAKQYLDLDPEAIEECVTELKSEIAETAQMLNVNMKPVDPAQVFMEAAQQLVRVSMDFDNQNRQLAKDNRQLQTQATTDSLTGLANRAAFDEEMERTCAARSAGEVPQALGILMLDVDKFKNFNDTHGHAAGDEVLQMVGKVLADVVRGGDFPARYGGEEFCVVMPQTTSFGLKKLAERIRAAIEAETVHYEGADLRVTISIGGACSTVIGGSADGQVLRKLADHYLYKAKENGRNRVEIYPKMRIPGK